MPDETMVKLDAALTRVLARPEGPTAPDVDRYSVVKNELDRAGQSCTER